MTPPRSPRPTPQVFVDAVTEATRILAQQIEQELHRASSWSGEPRGEVLWLSLLFCLHVTDRIAFARLCPVARNDFVGGILGLLAERTDEAVLRDKYSKSQQLWSDFKNLVPASGASPKGTLFWEFGKFICQQFDDMNPAVGVMLSMRASGIFQTLDHAFQELSQGYSDRL